METINERADKMPTNAERLRKAVEQRQQPRRMQSSATILSRNERMSIVSASSSDSECLKDLSSHILPYLTSGSGSSHRASTITTSTASSSASTLSHSNYTSPTIASGSVGSGPGPGRSPRRLFEKPEHRLDDPHLVVAYNYDHDGDDDDDEEEEEKKKKETVAYTDDPSTPIPTDVGMFSTNDYSETFLPISLRALDLDLDSSLHDALLTTFETTDLKPPPQPQPAIQIRPCGDPLGPLPANHDLARKQTFGSKFKKLARSLAN